MYQHWGIEVALAEHGRDVLQVLPDLLPTICVGRICGEGLNASTIREQPEMMDGLLMREAHDPVPALDYFVMMLV